MNGNEKTLQNALTTGLCGNGTPTKKYSTPNLLVYQYANEINITIGTSEMSLQDAIDTGKFCYSYSWGTNSWSTCTASCYGTHTRTVYCKRDDGGFQVGDDYCSDITPPATSEQCNKCVWTGIAGICKVKQVSLPCPSGACSTYGATISSCGGSFCGIVRVCDPSCHYVNKYNYNTYICKY